MINDFMSERGSQFTIEQPPDQFTTDREIANFWSEHLSQPCNLGPGREQDHVGHVYLPVAQDALKIMESKPAEQQDQTAISILRVAIQTYKALNC